MEREKEIKRTGELVVVGRDSITINLESTRHPRRIVVEFCDEPVIIPCDPLEQDQLGWSCHEGKHRCFYLTISWRVHGIREIKWRAHW